MTLYLSMKLNALKRINLLFDVKQFLYSFSIEFFTHLLQNRMSLGMGLYIFAEYKLVD